MNILTQFVSRFRDAILLILYLSISFLLMLSSDSAIVEGLRSSTLFSIGFLQEKIRGVNGYFSLESQNKTLRLENTRLAYENFKLQNALLENIILHRLLKFQHETNYKLIPAKIIGFSPQDFVSGFLLAINKDEHVQKNSAVITTSGLVGKIVKLSAKYAICQNLFDPNSYISVRIQRNRELGIVSWNGGSGLLLRQVPNTVLIKKGDVLFTSGMSRIFPRNIKVGHVTKVIKSEGQLFQTIQVKPAVNFNNIEELFIVQAEK